MSPEMTHFFLRLCVRVLILRPQLDWFYGRVFGKVFLSIYDEVCDNIFLGGGHSYATRHDVKEDRPLIISRVLKEVVMILKKINQY